MVARDDEIRLVDIALLPEHRGAGIGTALMRDLLAEAEQEASPCDSRSRSLIGPSVCTSVSGFPRPVTQAHTSKWSGGPEPVNARDSSAEDLMLVTPLLIGAYRVQEQTIDRSHLFVLDCASPARGPIARARPL